ncbi:MAG: hypothetical protein IKU42_02850 [Oscillospiraceae bacterium]|nr:hypothetical protein [Oscillospiraceae bacterium]
MNYIYLALGIILGIVFLGRGKNAKNKKYIPYEVKTKLRTKKTMEDYEDWCNREAKGCKFMGIGFMLFGFSATFIGSNGLVSTIIAVISLVVFIIGFFTRIYNNKTHLNHYFTKQ